MYSKNVSIAVLDCLMAKIFFAYHNAPNRLELTCRNTQDLFKNPILTENQFLISPDLDVCKLLLKQQCNVLHPFNVWHLKTLDHAFESAINVGKWDEAIEYGNELLPGFTKYCGKQNPLLGLIHMKLGKILLHRNQRKEALHNLSKASDIIKISHGQKHSLYETELIPLLMEASVNI